MSHGITLFEVLNSANKPVDETLQIACPFPNAISHSNDMPGVTDIVR